VKSGEKTADRASGFTCTCGKEHKFPAYVQAHWHDALRHTCSQCGRVHSIHEGSVTLIREPTK